MKITKQNLLKRSVVLFLAIALCVSVLCTTVFAEDSKNAGSQTYIVPIKSLASAAPIPAVQKAFADAFGKSVTLLESEDGTQTAILKNCHMIIDFLGIKYDANVASIEDANTDLKGTQSAVVISSKEEIFTNGIGGAKKDITVPDILTIPLKLDENNSQKMSITVDFMDAFMGGGKPFPTKVTLTLDMKKAKKAADVSGLTEQLAQCGKLSSKDYTEESFSGLAKAVENAQKVIINPESEKTVSGAVEKLSFAKKALMPAKNETTSAQLTTEERTTEETTAEETTATWQTTNHASTKHTESGNEAIDINNLADGTYEIPVVLWHATEDRESMAAKSLNGTARIVVKNGVKTMYIYTGPMSFGNNTACLQEMKVQTADGNWINASVESKSSSGDPDCFSFNIDEIKEYINVKVNPHVEMMGNVDLDARLKLSVLQIKLASENTDEKTTALIESTFPSNPNTGDDFNAVIYFVIMLVSMAAFSVAVLSARRKQTISE